MNKARYSFHTNGLTLAAAAFLLCYTLIASAQSISGNLSLLAGQPIRLEGFNGLKTYPISSARVRLYPQIGDVAAI